MGAPAKLSTLRQFTVPVSLKVANQIIECKVSPEVWADMNFRREMNERAAEIKKNQGDEKTNLKTDFTDYDWALAGLIVEWNLTDDNNNAVPINAETMSELWWQIKVELFDLILEVLSPKVLTQPMRRTTSAQKGQ